MNEEEFLFYFKDDNRQKINRLAELRKNVIKHIWQPIEDKELLGPLFKEQNYKLSVKTKIKATDNYVYYTFNSMSDKVMLTLCYDTLWDYDQHGCRIRLFLELQGEMIGFAQSHAQELRNLNYIYYAAMPVWIT